jgi:cobalamin biosynthesis Mg chelatase CobN
LAHKLDVKTQAKAKVEDVKAQTKVKVEDVKAQTKVKADEAKVKADEVTAQAKVKIAEVKDKSTTDEGKPRPEVLGGAAAIAVTVALLLIWLRRRR